MARQNAAMVGATTHGGGHSLMSPGLGAPSRGGGVFASQHQPPPQQLSAAAPSYSSTGQPRSADERAQEVSGLALRIVRRLMELSNGLRTDWRHTLQLCNSREILMLCDAVVQILKQ